MSTVPLVPTTFATRTNFPSEVISLIYGYLGSDERRRLVKGPSEFIDADEMQSMRLKSASQVAFSTVDKNLSEIARRASTDTFVINGNTFRELLGLNSAHDLADYLITDYEAAKMHWRASKYSHFSTWLLPQSISIDLEPNVRGQKEMQAVIHFLSRVITGKVIDTEVARHQPHSHNSSGQSHLGVKATENIAATLTDIVFLGRSMHSPTWSCSWTYRPNQDYAIMKHLKGIADTLPDLEYHVVDQGHPHDKSMVFSGPLPDRVSVYSAINRPPLLVDAYSGEYAQTSLRWFCGRPVDGKINLNGVKERHDCLEWEDFDADEVIVHVPLSSLAKEMVATIESHKRGIMKGLTADEQTFQIVVGEHILRT